MHRAASIDTVREDLVCLWMLKYNIFPEIKM